MEFLIWVKARQTMQLKALEAKELRGELTDKEMGQKAALEQAADVDLFDLAERAEESKIVVRGPQFYEAEKLEAALNCFREVMPTFPPPTILRRSCSIRWKAIWAIAPAYPRKCSPAWTMNR